MCLTNKKLVSKRPQPKQTFSTSGAMTSSKEDTNCLADPSGYFQNCTHAWDKYFHNTRGEKKENQFEGILIVLIDDNLLEEERRYVFKVKWD